MKWFFTFFIILSCIKLAYTQDSCLGGDESGKHGMPSNSTMNQADSAKNVCPAGYGLRKDSTGALICTPVVRPKDPNDIIGPLGYGNKRWVSAKEALHYTIHYENDPRFATASARNVIIEHFLDPHVTPNSFQMGSYGFGRFVYDIPGARTYYDTRLDVSNSLGVLILRFI